MSFFYLLILVLLISCNDEQTVNPYQDYTPKKFYHEAQSELSGGTLEQAMVLFNQLQATYPASKYAQQAKLQLAYALYDNSEYDQALQKFNHYIDLYPDSPSIDYAYYMRGVISEDKSKSLLSSMFIDKAQKNTKGSQQALNYYTILIDKFPHSKYSKEALTKLEKLQNELARHELLVAGFYYRKESYIACVNRIQYLIKNYPNTKAVPVALTLLKQTYQIMGLRKSQQDTQRILDINYPNIVINLKKELDL